MTRREFPTARYSDPRSSTYEAILALRTLREVRDGPGSVPLLAALLGTTTDYEDAPPGHQCHQNWPPRSEEDGTLTSHASPLLQAIARDLETVGLPHFAPTEQWNDWRDGLMSQPGDGLLKDYEKSLKTKPAYKKQKDSIIIPKTTEEDQRAHPPFRDGPRGRIGAILAI